MKDTLEDLREKIDEIDKHLFSLLQDRLAIVGRVAEYKKTNARNSYIIRPGREALKVKKAYDFARETGLDEKMSEAFAGLWRSIISLSINLEEPAKISFAPNGNKEMFWMLREYFGTFSTSFEAKSESGALEMLYSKKANISAFVLDYKPSSEPWWLELSKSQQQFSVFATLPLFSAPQSKTELILISNVTPEPTGQDKFVYVISGKIPLDEKESFEVISEYKGNYLVFMDEFYNNYQTKLNAKYLGCFATFDF